MPYRETSLALMREFESKMCKIILTCFFQRYALCTDAYMRAVKRVIAGVDQSVAVSGPDFDEAVRSCAPSVSVEELAFYEKLKF